MTTVTGVGEAVGLDGPLPVARRFCLLNTPGVVVEEVPAEGPTPRWMSGIAVYGYPAGTPFDWEPCTTGTFRVKETSAVSGDEDPIPGDRFVPFAVYFPLECSTIDAHKPAFIDRAKAALNATLSHGVEKALANGVPSSPNRFFADGNLVPLAGAAAVKPSVGLSYLENAIGSRTGREGMIHATPAVVSAWGIGAGLDNQESEEVEEGGPDTGPELLLSPVGTPIVSGSGYIGADPVSYHGKINATTDWAFATGPVEVRIGDGPNVTIAQSVDRSINLTTIYPERFVVADWDVALQVGVLIDWSLQ